MTDQFSAQDPALGYLFQIRYALLFLLEAREDGQEFELAIENLDDIDIVKDGNELKLIQIKLHRNPDFLTDACSDLWKTIRIWCTNLKNKKIQLENVVLTILTTGIAPNGSIANMLRPKPFGNRDVDTAVEKLIHIANTSKSQTNQGAYAIFTSLSKEEQTALVEKIQVLDGSPGILDLRKKTLNILTCAARKEYVEAVYEHIVGRWDDLVIRHLYERSSNYISYKELSNMIDDIREQYYRDSLPIHFPRSVQIDQNELNEDQRMFIEQLKLVKIGQKRVNHAISDFYRSSRQRSKWIRDLSIPISELELYDEKLYYEWERIFATMEEDLEYETVEEVLIKEGRNLYEDMMRLNFHIRVRCTEEFITRGSYHMLANQLRLGWHLNFKVLLSHLQNCEKEAAS
ncbi:ABC-three component system protein [Dictyobacter aurantiacus]|uniref:Uncharacterized protein n=1 Tax=Dictyobacter aurantiacus TaxID=1936993 RepID=A0A401ZRI7_9CHLR|nr:ABC-three component system protein [Dictyobacter aurantiacus]GCE09481.1 hypothetical protein KDAU_68100 [Dictyobacter aurantiacus]